MLLTGCFAPLSDRDLNQSGIRRTARANVPVRRKVPLILSLELDLACLQSVHKVEDDITQSPPLAASWHCSFCGARWSHMFWCPLIEREPSRVSANVRAAIHEREDGQRCTIQIGAEIAPPERAGA